MSSLPPSSDDEGWLITGEIEQLHKFSSNDEKTDSFG